MKDKQKQIDDAYHRLYCAGLDMLVAHERLMDAARKGQPVNLKYSAKSNATFRAAMIGIDEAFGGKK